MKLDAFLIRSEKEMRVIPKIGVAAVATLSIAAIAFSGTSATAAAPLPTVHNQQLDSSDQPNTGVLPAETLTALWDEYGVSTADQQGLLAKAEAGLAVDSMLGGTPLSVETHPEERGTTTVQRFPDGSINVTFVEEPAELGEGDVAARAVEGCTTQGLNGRRNCSVWGTFGLVYLGFIADYTIGDGVARINAYRAPTVQATWPLSTSTPSFEVTRLAQAGSLPADMALSVVYTGAGSGTTRLVFQVQNRAAWTN
ncbi:hypothetical protein [Microbacterium phyllosphaerae]|uniref:hypothetical protein n=1 Tax=Microbacterium phyllosphaerae TaxID=124798 RepID=UPI0011AE8C62|nr:hypothetical protein [Microbacterium phyllosphaerae]